MPAIKLSKHNPFKLYNHISTKNAYNSYIHFIVDSYYYK